MEQEQIIMDFAKRRKGRIAGFIFGALTIVLIPFLLQGLAPDWLRIAIAAVGVVVMLYQNLVNWRCPKCSRLLGREFSYRHCPHCGSQLMQ